MGKHGPCYHCGVTSTPLWRNGPPEKPVLCNACGSRWRTKGTLENYTPLHLRAEADGVEDQRVYKVKTFPVKNKEAKALKRKYDSDATESGGVPLDFNSQGFQRVSDEDTSNRSSSGSAISNLESCAQYCGADANDLAGPSQPMVCDSFVPSRKRRCTAHLKPSPVEKLTKDLYTIWHEQQSSCLSSSLDDDLLVESDKPMVSVEIGHGSMLIRHPISITREEESEASSLYIDKNRHDLSSQPMALHSLIEGREKGQPEKLQILAHHNSPLGHIDLQESKGKSVIEEPETVKSNALATDYSLSATRPRDGVNQKFSGAKAIMRSPKRVVMGSSCNNEEVKIDEDRCFASPKRLFISDFSNESCEEDLLLDIPCNSSTSLYSYFGP